MSDTVDQRQRRIRGTRRLTVAQRLWRAVDPSGSCHLFTGTTTARGYGQIWHDGRRVLVHRLTWQLSGGTIPAGYAVDHLCHTPACVNIHHLRLATSVQNQANRPGRPDYSLTDITGLFWLGSWDGKYRAVLSGGGTSILVGHYRQHETAALALEQAAAGYQPALPGMGLLSDAHDDGGVTF